METVGVFSRSFSRFPFSAGKNPAVVPIFMGHNLHFSPYFLPSPRPTKPIHRQPPTRTLMARLDVGIETQELALASNTLNSVVWMVLTFAGGNELQYRATFHLLARPSPRYRGLLLRIH